MNLKGKNKYIISYPDYKNFKGILTNTYKQTKEFVNPLYFFLPTEEKVGVFDTKSFLNSIFNGVIVDLPRFNIIEPDIEKHERFEEFTKRDEVNNISLWVLAAIEYLSSSPDLLLGKELEIIQAENPRDGRLDDVAVRERIALIIETKTDLKSALSENRFLYQIPNYMEECIKSINEQWDSGTVLILLGVGGEETDLFPPNHPDCTTGTVGDISKIFYDKILEKGIRFISANALWCLVTYKFVTGKKIDVLDFIISTFSDKNSVGLLSGGVVLKEDGGFVVNPINLEDL